MAEPRAINKWQDGISLFLAVWLYLSPFGLAFVPGALTTGMPAAAWNAWIVSVVIGVFSAAALYRAWPIEEWIKLLLGAWLVISPWAVGYVSDKVMTWNALTVGALTLVLAIWELKTIPQTVQPNVLT